MKHKNSFKYCKTEIAPKILKFPILKFTLRLAANSGHTLTTVFKAYVERDKFENYFQKLFTPRVDEISKSSIDKMLNDQFFRYYKQ